MRSRILGLLMVGLTVACGFGDSQSGPVESLVWTANDASHARELMTHCANDVWSVHVRTSVEVRAVEVETLWNVAYAPLDYPMRANGMDEPITGWGFVLPVHVARTEAEAKRLSGEGVVATMTPCDAGELSIQVSLRNDSFEELECVTLGPDISRESCTDFEAFVTKRL